MDDVARDDDLDSLCVDLESGWSKAEGDLKPKTKQKGRGAKRTHARMRLFDAFAKSLYRLPPTSVSVWVYLLSRADDHGYVHDVSLTEIGKGVGKHRNRVADALKHLLPEYIEIIEAVPGKTPVYALRDGF